MFNYQVIFKANDDERIIFAGKTDCTPDELLGVLDLRVSDELNSLTIESFIYQPVNIEQNETSKKVNS